MSKVIVEKTKYRFPEYAEKRLARMTSDLVVRDKRESWADASCGMWVGDRKIAYISINTYEGGDPAVDNNMIRVGDEKYLPQIKSLLENWAKYYGYHKDLKVLLSGHKEIEE